MATSDRASGPSNSEVLEIRLTKVKDVTSFWAQIGTSKNRNCIICITLWMPLYYSSAAKHLLAYENQQREMSMWCGECVAGCHTSSSSLKLDSIVAVRGKTEGNWFRAKVMKIMAEKYKNKPGE